jgi:hypothetical protein
LTSTFIVVVVHSTFISAAREVLVCNFLVAALNCDMGIDLEKGGRIKKGGRKAPVSENPYLRLLVKFSSDCSCPVHRGPRCPLLVSRYT